MDTISLLDISLAVDIGSTCWGKDGKQPVVLTIHLHTDVELAGNSDNLDGTVDYSEVSKDVLEFLQNDQPFSSLHSMTTDLTHFILGSKVARICKAVRVVATAPKQVLCADGLTVDVFRHREGKPYENVIDSLSIDNIHASVIIGVNGAERDHQQRLTLSLKLDAYSRKPIKNCSEVVEKVVRMIQGSSYLTLEALSLATIRSVFRNLPLESAVAAVTVRVEKPSGLILGKASAITAKRDRAWFAARSATN